MKRLLALLLAFAMVFSLAACGSSSTESETSTSGSESTTENSSEATEESSEAPVVEVAEEDVLTDPQFYELASRELETHNILLSQNASDLQVLTNLYDGLLTNDTHGNLISCLAEEWGTEDGGLTWTFTLRQDAVWVDYTGAEKQGLTANDFVAGLEWVLNAAKNESFNTSMPMELIEGAADYYNYTAELVEDGNEEEALALAWNNETFLDMVGIEAVDDYTLVYTCITEKPYFDTVTTYNCLYPLAVGLIDEIGVDGLKELSYDTTWYSGPYIMTEYIHGNEKVLEQNPLWWGAEENTRFNSVTIKMVDSADVAYQLYQTGELDQVSLSESNLSIIYNDASSEFYNYLVEARPTKYSYQIHFVYNKNDDDGTPDVNWNTAVANEAFRLSWYYGLDLTSYYRRTNAINPMKCENNFYTMTNVAITSDGTDYTELVRQELGLPESDGETMARLDSDLAQQYKEQAMEELSAQGVTFPVEIDYYIAASSQTALDSANVLKQCFTDSLGDDYVVLNIQTYVSSLATEVRTPKLASIYISGWGADYGDPQNYLVQETFGNDNAYYSAVYSVINDFYEDPDADPEDPEYVAPAEPYNDELIEIYEEYTRLVNEADAITDDLDARYAAYAVAEAYLIEHALVIPCNYDVSWQLTCVNDYSKIYAAYGIQNNRYLNWETNANGFTTADYEAFAAAYNSAAE